MPKTPLTVQLHLDNEWRDVAGLQLGAMPDDGGNLTYDMDYWIEHIQAQPGAGVGMHEAIVSGLPVVSESSFFRRWPAFLDDIRPAGAANRWWRKRLGLPPGDDDTHALDVLQAGSGSPIGHMRIKESVLSAPAQAVAPPLFDQQSVVERTSDFLDYANEAGAAVGGASGAGGDAAKLLLRQDPQTKQVWIDGLQEHHNGFRPTDNYVFVKFARGTATPVDCLILRTEAAFYRAVARIGLTTVDTDTLELLESSPRSNGPPVQPSLWMRRFDIKKHRDGQVERFAVESFYALMNARAGSRMSFFDVIERLLPIVGPANLSQLPAQQQAALHHNTALEVMRRDLLNMLLGNTDNHGRNWALLRTSNEIRFAPIYDLAPMKLDPASIARTTRWGDLEPNAGQPPFWRHVCDELSSRFRTLDGDALFTDLEQFAGRAAALPDLLAEAETPDESMNRASLGDIPQRLQRWGLLP
jgi:serine/threonine-protein kinase HipA